jgi:hypothetical protein
MSANDAVWTPEFVDVEVLLPMPLGWDRVDYGDDRLGELICWEFDGGEWGLRVCSPQAVDPDNPEADVPEEVKRLLPNVRYRIGLELEPGGSEEAWTFLNTVVAALADGGHGVGFDVFTGEPVRS